MPVQVNGRTRFRIEVAAGLGAAAVEAAVRAHPEYARWTAGGSVERMVIVPDRIVNIIVRQADTARVVATRRDHDHEDNVSPAMRLFTR